MKRRFSKAVAIVLCLTMVLQSYGCASIASSPSETVINRNTGEVTHHDGPAPIKNVTDSIISVIAGIAFAFLIVKSAEKKCGTPGAGC
ncbi:MAG: hypothetical protein WAO71_09645 [Gallionella sp.]